MSALVTSYYRSTAVKGYFAGCKPVGVFREVVSASWEVLKLSAGDKSRVLIRLDSGYGTTEIINYLLSEGYQFVTKMFATLRAKKLDRAIAEAAWHSDPCHPGRSVTGLAAQTASLYTFPALEGEGNRFYNQRATIESASIRGINKDLKLAKDASTLWLGRKY